MLGSNGILCNPGILGNGNCDLGGPSAWKPAVEDGTIPLEIGGMPPCGYETGVGDGVEGTEPGVCALPGRWVGEGNSGLGCDIGMPGGPIKGIPLDAEECIGMCGPM